MQMLFDLAVGKCAAEASPSAPISKGKAMTDQSDVVQRLADMTDKTDIVERLIYTHEHGIFDAQVAGMLASPKEANHR